MLTAYGDVAGKHGTLFGADVCQRVSCYGRGRRERAPIEEIQGPHEARNGEGSALRVQRGVMLV